MYQKSLIKNVQSQFELKVKYTNFYVFPKMIFVPPMDTKNT